MSVAYLSSRGITNNILLLSIGKEKHLMLGSSLPHLSTVYIDWSKYAGIDGENGEKGNSIY